MQCTDKIPVNKILGDKMLVKIAREDKMLAIVWDSEGKKLILKQFICHINGQLN